MITLLYAELTPQMLYFQERLKELALTHQLCKQEDLREPELRYGSDQVRGEAAIAAYLDELEVLVQQWYACRCDKYEDNADD
jgi:hypothetical protein